MKTRFWTKSGSEYLIDHDEKVWYRGHNPNSLLVRTANGVYYEVSTIEVGKSVAILCPPMVPEASVRLITTTAVVKMLTETN